METKKCKQCWIQFEITDSDLAFYDKVSPIFVWKKYQIPSPTLCPDCRQQRRLAWRNERNLYHNVCSFTEKPIISLYSKDKNVVAYHHDIYRSDKWDAIDYGRDFDFSRWFFEQFEELLNEAPLMATYNKRTENTEYGNNIIEDKDSYMVFLTFANENCYYGYTIGYCKNCVDCLWILQSQNCYECVKVQNCYECFWCVNCSECFNSRYLADCMGVDSSAFCIWLRNKKYHFLNKAYSKYEFKEILEKLKTNKVFLQKTKSDFEELKSETPVKANFIEQSEWCFGDYLENCKNCTDSFDLFMAEDCKYCYDGGNLADSMDTTFGGAPFTRAPAQLLYESYNSVNWYRMLFTCSMALFSKDMLYCESCDACENCFGCVSLRNKSYCILNKQYTQEEYENLVVKIIEHMQKKWEWWEFFPISTSLFAYNETDAQVYYPMSKEEVEAKWWKRFDQKDTTKVPENSQVVPTSELLDDIKDIDDEILNKVILCEVTGKPFRFIKQELDFYRKYDLPLPRRCRDQRHLDRMKFKHPRKLWDRSCQKCWSAIKTPFDSNYPGKVYCESCYNKEVYG